MNRNWIYGVILALIAVSAVWAFQRGTSGTRQSMSAATASISLMLEDAEKQESAGQKVAARDIYKKILAEYPEYEKAEAIQEKLGALNIAIITSTAMTPQTVVYSVVPGDSLGRLAKRFNTTKELIKKSNGLKSDVIRVGQKLRIWNTPFQVFVDKSQNILVLRMGEDLVKTYSVSTGANNITPTGSYKIATKLVDPVWFKPGSAPVPPESPENVLGTRWMGFDTDPHYGIHGTIEEDKIGMQVTAGCVRLRNSDVEELFDILPMGTPVVITD